MLRSDLGFAADLAVAQGWLSETRDEFEGFLAREPTGCFVAEWDGGPVGVCVTSSYGESGVVGNFIVATEVRGRGIGTQILEHAIAYLRGRGVRNVLLDAAPAAIPLYERVGFRKVCPLLRFVGPLAGQSRPGVRPMVAADLEAVVELDREAFGGDRSFFLERRRSALPELCQVLERGGTIAGYVMGRRAGAGVAVGPWVVRADHEHPEDLLVALPGEGGQLDVSVRVLATNARAVATVRTLGLVERPEQPWRMVFGPAAHLGCGPACYSPGPAAKG